MKRISHNFIYSLLLVLLTLLTYGRVFFSDFIEAYDDEIYVTLNSAIAHGFNTDVLRWSLTTFRGGNWTPVTWWSHALDIQLYGMNPVGHHATNLVFHIINILLVYSLFRRMTAASGKSFVVAALFALHPLHVESVAWVAERKDVLSAFFGLCSIHAYVVYRSSRSVVHYGVMLLLLCMSLMAKPMLVTLPALLFAFDFWPFCILNRQSWRGLIREKLPLLIPSAVICVVTIIAQNSQGALATVQGTPISARIGIALDGYVYYIRALFYPHNLAFFYPYVAAPLYRLCIEAAILGAITWLAWRFRNRFAWLLSGWLWFLVALVPVIGIVAVGSHAYADRYTYLPSLGIFAIMVWGGGAILEKVKCPSRGVVMASQLVVIVSAALTFRETGYWKDGFALYRRAVDVTSGNWLAHNNLGAMLNNRERYREAIGELEQAAALAPDINYIHYNLAVAHDKSGHTVAARQQYQAAIALAPTSDDNYYAALARTMWGDSELPEALNVLRRGVRLFPSSSLLKGDEGYVLMRMGRVDEAINSFKEALQLEPGYMQLYPLLAKSLVSRGRVDEALGLYRHLQSRDPREAQKLLLIVAGVGPD